MGVGIEVVVGVVANHGGLIERKIAISRFSEPRSSEFCIKHGITEVLGINCHLEFAFNMQDLTYFTCICTNILITSTFLKRGFSATDFCPKSFEALDQTSSNCLALMSQSRQIITSVDMTYFFADFFRHSQMKTHVCSKKGSLYACLKGDLNLEACHKSRIQVDPVDEVQAAFKRLTNHIHHAKRVAIHVKKREEKR